MPVADLDNVLPAVVGEPAVAVIEVQPPGARQRWCRCRWPLADGSHRQARQRHLDGVEAGELCRQWRGAVEYDAGGCLQEYGVNVVDGRRRYHEDAPRPGQPRFHAHTREQALERIPRIALVAGVAFIEHHDVHGKTALAPVFVRFQHGLRRIQLRLPPHLQQDDGVVPGNAHAPQVGLTEAVARQPRRRSAQTRIRVEHRRGQTGDVMQPVTVDARRVQRVDAGRPGLVERPLDAGPVCETRGGPMHVVPG